MADLEQHYAEIDRHEAEVAALVAGLEQQVRDAGARAEQAAGERDALLAEVERLRALWAAVAKDSGRHRAEAEGRRKHGETLKAERDAARAARLAADRTLGEQIDRAIEAEQQRADHTRTLRDVLDHLQGLDDDYDTSDAFAAALDLVEKAVEQADRDDVAALTRTAALGSKETGP